MLLVGVDEAGYGPLLGPLTVAGTAFRLDLAAGAEPPGDVGARLLRALAGPRARDGTSLRIGDSKKVYGSGGLTALERPLLACLQLAGAPWPGRLDDVLTAVGVDPAERRDRAWYCGDPVRFPLRHDPGALDDVVSSLGDRLARQGLSVAGLQANVITEDRLNAAFEATGNKGTVLFDETANVVERLLDLALPGEPALVICDRQGGRRQYLPPLQRRWPEAFVWTLGEERRLSRYRFGREGRRVEIHFAVGADGEAPQVGLASMLAKYLREVFMGLWNDWFATRCPGVRPTAGYTQDGRRWLEETRVAREAAGIDDEQLARTR